METSGEILKWIAEKGEFLMMKTQAVAEVFLTALRSLPKADRERILLGLVKDKTLRRDLMDLATIEERRKEPSRPFREYLSERRERG